MNAEMHKTPSIHAFDILKWKIVKQVALWTEIVEIISHNDWFYLETIHSFVEEQWFDFLIKKFTFIKVEYKINQIKIIIESQHRFNFNEWLTQKQIKFERHEVRYFEWVKVSCVSRDFRLRRSMNFLLWLDKNLNRWTNVHV